MRKHKFLWLLAVMLCLLLPLKTMATEPVRGSLTVVDLEHSICLHHVATLDAELTAPFANAPVKDLTAQTTAVTNARILRDYAMESAISGRTQTPDTDGTVFYGDLEMGLYLVYSLAEEAEFQPFLVKIPTEVAGKIIYDVEADPKEDEEEPTEPDTTPTEPDTTPTEPPTPNIPQTGTSVWPKYILLALGMLAAIAGFTDLILGREKKG